MYWGDLMFVVAVHRHGSFSGAAKALGVTHTTVARRIKDLEQRYGSRLVDAERGGAALTAAGVTVLETALRIEDQMLELERQVSGIDDRLTGALRLTTCDAGAWLYAESFRGFSDNYPQIELELIVDNEIRDLARREADVAIRATGDPPPDLIGRRIDRLDHAVYGARSLLERRRPTNDFRDLPWITYAAQYPRRQIEGWMNQHVPGAKVAAQVDTTLIMLRAAQAGIGVAVLPTALGDDDPELERLTLPIEELSQDIWLLTPRELMSTARIRAFYSHMAGIPRRH
ncbi:LysR family transcriptional regulator [Zavarzinia sp.]|uniref:LysR family transcriptional regulator n=1 Tax=Zavarzinia sp. TaxID=2027920 RepID=UPI003BB620AF